MPEKSKNPLLKLQTFCFAASLFGGQTMAAEIAEEKKVVSLEEYFDIQSAKGKTFTHLNYTPFPRQIIDVPVHSNIHGDITVHFNTHMFIPTWNDRNANKKIDSGEIGLIPTMGIIAGTHAGLGDLNKNDSPSALEAMNIIAKDIKPVKIEFLNETSGDEHLKDKHGIALFVQKNGVVMPGEQMKPIAEACRRELQP